MHAEPGSRFIDWFDHIRLNRRDLKGAQLESVGYRIEGDHNACGIHVNTGGLLPPILAWDGNTEVWIRVESVADFLAANQLQRDASGGPLALLRTCRVHTARDYAWRS
jgi:hypothetical protein